MKIYNFLNVEPTLWKTKWRIQWTRHQTSCHSIINQSLNFLIHSNGISICKLSINPNVALSPLNWGKPLPNHLSFKITKCLRLRSSTILHKQLERERKRGETETSVPVVVIEDFISHSSTSGIHTDSRRFTFNAVRVFYRKVIIFWCIFKNNQYGSCTACWRW